MTTPFLRLDVTSNARDFEPVAIRPGMLVLDPNGTHYASLRKWLGRFVAEPSVDGDNRRFQLYVCDDQGNRPHDVQCEPTDPKDRSIQREWQELQELLGAVVPEPVEEPLLRAVRQQAESLSKGERNNSLFKYRDARGIVRLVWCCGFGRKQANRPDKAAICTNPGCRQLFLVFEGNDCPACSQRQVKAPEAAKAPASSGSRRRVGWLAPLLVVALVAAAAGYFGRGMFASRDVDTPPLPEQGLEITPAEWKGPVGGHVEFQVRRREADSLADATAAAVAVVEHPRVVRVEQGRLIAQSPGSTVVHYYVGDEEVHARIDVETPRQPASLRAVPERVTLGVGTTTELRIEGEYGDDAAYVDLTAAVEWAPALDGLVACQAGRLEGLVAGETAVTARYRASLSDAYRSVTIPVEIRAEEFTQLELRVLGELVEGRLADLGAEVVTAQGERRSVLGSSRLRLDATPVDVAVVEDGKLRALRPGRGVLEGVFGAHTVTLDFEVAADLSGRFVVTPREVELVVGEIADLQVSSASSSPVRTTSGAPEIVEVLPSGRLVGRRAGNTELTVVQEAREVSIPVRVTEASLESLAFAPPRISVLVDESAPVRLLGQAEGRAVELAPDAVRWSALPDPEVAELNVEELRLRGRRPTLDQPQIMVAKHGDLRAEARIDVVAGALQIELTPSGPVALRLGEVGPLQVWARYGDGRRVEVPAERVEWDATPADSRHLRLDTATGAVRALQAGATLTVSARYQGFASNRVDIQSLGDSFPLTLTAEHELILVGDRGQLVAEHAATSPENRLVGVVFTSSAPEVLQVDKATGQYVALAPGSATVTATHPGASSPATLALEVRPRSDATLELVPAQLQLLTNARQELAAQLVVGDVHTPIPLGGEGEAQLSIGSSDAVEWRPPFLIGRRPTAPFEIAVERDGLVGRAMVEVLPAQGAIRVVPEGARLSPGQAISPRVEQQAPGADVWQEVEPELVVWQVPATVRWTPARGDLRPHLSPADEASGSVELVASYAGERATLTVEIGASPPPSGPLVVVREPSGDDLEVGREQRYSIWVDGPDGRVPATDVRWEAPFENDDVQWLPPVLRAKRPGREQWLTVQVGDETLRFRTRTVPAAPAPQASTPPPAATPEEVRIVCEAGSPVRLAPRARFTDFRVEALYSGGRVRNVTSEAALRLADDSTAPSVSLAAGEVTAIRAGKAEMRAMYQGVPSVGGLSFDVADDLVPDALELRPDTFALAVGERSRLRVEGRLDGRSVGEVTDCAGLEFVSDHPEIATLEGAAVVGATPGRATVTVAFGAASAHATVDVRGATAGSVAELRLAPSSLRLRVGESQGLGSDVVARRGAATLDLPLEAVSSAPEIVQFNPRTRSLEGIAPGQAQVAVSVGDNTLTLPVRVVPAAELVAGEVVVEPSTGMLAIGEELELRVFVVGAQGGRIDRTSSAVFTSADPAIVRVLGNQATGLGDGDTVIRVRVPEVSGEGTASISVKPEPFTSIVVSPSPLSLVVGERQSLRIEGLGAGGRRPLGRHPGLRVVASGPASSVVDVQGTEVRGVQPGEATLRIELGELRTELPVAVVAGEVTGLRIEPQQIHVTVGREESFVVLAQRGGRELPVTMADGLEVRIANPQLASRGRELSVTGRQPGATELAVQLGGERAVAQLLIEPTSGRDPAADMPPGLRFIPDVLRMQLGVPGGTVRLVRVLADGSVEDLDHRAEFDIPAEGREIVDVSWTASGPVFVAKRIGETTATARLGALTTASPLQILVVDPDEPDAAGQPPAGPPRLEATPDPLRLVVGETAELSEVRVVFDDAPPSPLDYTLESSDPAIVVVEGRELRGTAAGRAQVTVRPGGPGSERFAELRTTVAVEVSERGPRPTEGSSGETRLVLSGPSRSHVGGLASFHVELMGGGAGEDVTQRGAELVLDAGQDDAAELRHGCVLSPLRPGSLQVKARYQNQVSNPVTLVVDPAADSFERLEIEIDKRPLEIGERRAYRVWGLPVGGGPRQELTEQVRLPGAGAPPGAPLISAVVTAPSADAPVMGHEPPALVGKAAGRFRLGAAHGALRSPVVDLEVAAGAPESGRRLRADPATLVIRIGERSAPLRVLAEGEGAPRVLEAAWTSADSAVAAPDAAAPGVVTGVGAGRTTLTAQVGEQRVSVAVEVQGNVFHEVRLDPKPAFLPDNRFSVTVQIEARDPGVTREYRISMAGSSADQEWRPMAAGDQRLTLVSPALRQGRPGEKYHLVVEARDPATGKITDVRPLSFQMTTTAQQGGN